LVIFKWGSERREDKEREWTYTRGGKSVIDYVIINEEIREERMKIEVRDQVDLDYHPVIIKLKERKKKGESKKGSSVIRMGINRGKWDEKQRKWFRAEREGIGEGNIQEAIRKMGTRIRETLGKMEGKRGRGRNI